MALSENRDWLGSLYSAITGEDLLKARPNGGEVIMARSLITSCWLYAAAVLSFSATAEGALFEFSSSQLLKDVHETLPWAGAIFAAVYIALYTRYSNQWAYLGNLYNQIMAAKASTACNSAALARWQAGFIVDAYTLHLDRKPLFRGVIETMAKEPLVKDVLTKCFTAGERATFSQRFGVDLNATAE